MAKDDYDVVLFKILTYLYGCMKRKYSFDIHAFNAVISKQNVNDEYLSDILVMATDEELKDLFLSMHGEAARSLLMIYRKWELYLQVSGIWMTTLKWKKSKSI